MSDINKPADPGPAGQVRCDEHHWVSTHQPDFPVYWITQCSICGHYDPVAMAEEIAKVVAKSERVPLTAEVTRLEARADRFAVLSSQDQDHAVKAISERNTALRTIAKQDATIEANSANAAENEALRAEVASLRAFQLQPRAALDAPTEPAPEPERESDAPSWHKCSDGCPGYGAVNAADDRRSL